MNTAWQSAKRDVAVAVLLASMAFCIGSIPALIVLMLLVEENIFGWFIAAFVLSNIAFALISNLFEQRQKIDESRRTHPVPKAWYRQYALLIGLVVGFIVTFVTAGLRLDIL
ncbi:hypothetical protein [Yoonia sp. 2307UL14-13]|uniref:hypothetical protein n=1 Tax=Yoonia sp. 2307UL14-13 TaxID=3126506 RepID=UPI0030AB60FE